MNAASYCTDSQRGLLGVVRELLVRATYQVERSNRGPAAVVSCNRQSTSRAFGQQKKVAYLEALLLFAYRKRIRSSHSLGRFDHDVGRHGAGVLRAPQR